MYALTFSVVSVVLVQTVLASQRCCFGSNCNGREEWHKPRVGEKGTRQSVSITYLPFLLCSIKLLSVSREKICDLERWSYAEFGWKVVYNKKTTLFSYTRTMLKCTGFRKVLVDFITTFSAGRSLKVRPFSVSKEQYFTF